MNLQNDIKKILVSQEEIEAITTRLAAEVSRDYAGKNLLLVGTLKGSVVFMADLMKKITIPAQIDFIKASSYGAGTSSSGTLTITLDLKRTDLENWNILIVEDIVDSGRTLIKLKEMLLDRGAASVKTISLLNKPSRRERPIDPDYAGIVVPDEFVVGYGLDYNEDYRNLPFVGVLKEEVYSG